MAISEGNSRENAMQDLYSQLMCLENALADDEYALTWFNFSTDNSANLPPSSPSINELPPAPSAGSSNRFFYIIMYI